MSLHYFDGVAWEETGSDSHGVEMEYRHYIRVC